MILTNNELQVEEISDLKVISLEKNIEIVAVR